MNGLEGVWDAVLRIGENKLRTFLTMLGIIIGVTAVILLVSVGQGASSSVTSQLEGLGSNLISVTGGGGVQLTAADAQELEQRVPTITAAVPVLNVPNGTVARGRASYSTTVEGTWPQYATIRDLKMAQGRFLQPLDESYRLPVAVIGQTVAQELFGGGPVIGQSLEVNGTEVTVVGELAPIGSSFGQNNDDVVFLPLSLAQQIAGTNRVNQIMAQARSAQDAQLAANHIATVMDLEHGQPGESEPPVRVFNQTQLLSALGTATQTLTMMLAAIAAISLVVGGIGIMNIMLVTVSERTREIGIRKALGATRRNILVQFLTESAVLSLAGGVIGMAVGVAGSLVIDRLMHFPPVVAWSAIVGAFVFSAAVGLFFGVYPAMRAAALDPVEALRYE
ncbi:MAG: ABC transporter permease [Clostridia bacterium]|nr:ABC transporter permease [Clostridia bacterium]MCL6520788.1 ABC transporter permease [Bacillota bacterium]